MHPSAPHTHAAVILAACLALASPSVAVAQDKVEAAEQRARWQQVFNKALSQGSKLRRNNQASQATQVYLNALGNLPAHVDNMDFRQSLARQLGQTYEDMKQVEAAVGVYRQIPALQPLGTQALKNAGQMDRAIAYAVSVGDLLGLGRIYETKGDEFAAMGQTEFVRASAHYKNASEAYSRNSRADPYTVTALLAGISLKYGEMALQEFRLGIPGTNVTARGWFKSAYKAYDNLKDSQGGSLGVDGMVEAAHGEWLVRTSPPDPTLETKYLACLKFMGTDAIQNLGALHQQMNKVRFQRADLERKKAELTVPKVTYPDDPARAKELQERLRARMTHVRDTVTKATADAQTQLLEGMSRECARLGRASQLLGDLPRAAKAYVKAEQLLEKYIKTVDRVRWTQLQNGEFRRRFAELKKKRVEVLNEAQLSPADVISPPNANAPDILDRLLSSPGG